MSGRPMSGFAGRLALAFLQPRFQLVMVAWLTLILAVFSFPDPRAYGIDAHVYRHGLENMLAGRPAYLVPDPVATAISGGRGIYLFPPPPAAILGGAVAMLPMGGLLWFLVGVAAVALGYLAARAVVPRDHDFRAAVGTTAAVLLPVLAWFLFQPTLQAMLYGNQQTFLLLGLSLAALGMVRDRPALVGIGLGLSILLRPAPILFLGPLLVARRWAEVAWTSAVVAVGLAVSVAVVGIQPWLDFADALLRGADIVATQGYNMAPLAPLFPGIPEWAWVVATGLAMAATGVLPARRMLVASIGLFLLGWPVQWMSYGTAALVALAISLPDRRLRLGLAAAYLLFQVYWRVAWLPAGLILVIAGIRPDLLARLQAAVGGSLARVAGSLRTTVQPRPD